MEQVVNLDNARMLDNYRKILDEKKLSDEKTMTEMRNTARRRVLDGISIKNMTDVSSLLKYLAPIRYTYPDIYEQEKTIEIPLLLGSLGINDTPKTRADFTIELAKLETELTKEIGPILGIDEREFSVIELFTSRYALDYTNGVIIDLEVPDRVTNLEGFKLLHADRKVHDGKKEVTVPEYLLKHSLLKCIDGFTTDPQLPTPLIVSSNPMKTTYSYNNWKGFKAEVIEAPLLDSPDKHCSAILDHIYTYSVNKNKEQYETTLGWMAHMIQKPWEKPGWAILYSGREGCGKDVIARTLGKMMHRDHWLELGHYEFTNPRETGWRKGRLLVNVTEFRGLNDKIIPHVYQLIEAPEARIRELYHAAYTSKDITRHILTTNNTNAIQAKLDSRRFLIPDFNDEMGTNHDDTPDRRAFKHAHFTKIYDEIGGKEIGKIGPGVIAFYQYLKQYDISKFDIKQPNLETAFLDEMIETNETTLDILINDIIYRGEIPDYSEISFEPPIQFNLTRENIIEGSLINNKYKRLFEKTLKERGTAHPPVGQICRYLVKGLGLPWEGKERKNNRTHYKLIRNQLHYVFPSLEVLRNIYFKLHPHKRPPQ